jgi:hypothetical protein
VRFYLLDVCVTASADDTILTICSNSIDELVQKYNEALARIELLMDLTLLCIKVNETFLVTLSRVETPVDVFDLVLLSRKLVRQVNRLGYLGVFIDSLSVLRYYSDDTSSRISR